MLVMLFRDLVMRIMVLSWFLGLLVQDKLVLKDREQRNVTIL
jgi:hypothetical protein